MLRILLIDNDNDDQASISGIIYEAFPGSAIYTFINGAEGIQWAIDNTPDVILLNASFAHMDGMEICRQLKKDQKINNIPVLFLLTNQDKEWKLKALEAGAEGFLSLPVDPAELIAQIKAMSKIKRSILVADEEPVMLNEAQTVIEGFTPSNETSKLNEYIFQTIADAAYDWEFLIDQNRHFIYCSPSCERITGYKREQFMADYDLLNRIVHPDDQTIYRKHLLEVHTIFQAGEINFRIIRADGAVRWLGHVCCPIVDKAGALLAIRGSNRDITDQMLFEERLKNSEDKYRSIFENVQDVYYEASLDGVLLEISPSVEMMTRGKYKREDFIGQTIKDVFINIKEREVLRNALFEQGSISDFEISVQFKDGEVIPCTVTAKIWLDLYGKPQKLIGSIRDITNRKKAEDSLRQSEESYRNMFENNPQPMFIYDQESLSFVRVNNAAIQFYGYSEDEFLSMTAFDIRPAEDFIRFAQHNSKNKPKYNVSGEWRHIKKDGETVTVNIVSHALMFNNRPARYVLVNDVTERHKAEEKLQKSEEKFRAIFENNSAVKLLINPYDGQIVDANKAAGEYYGWSCEELRKMKIQQINTLPSKQTMAEMQKMKTSDQCRFEFMHRHKDGSLTDVEVFSSKVKIDGVNYLHSIIHDISDRKKAEKEIAHSHELMRYVIEHNRSCVAIHDKDLKYIYVSQRYLEDYHIKENIIGKHHYDVFPDLPQKWKDVHQKALAGETSSGNDDPYEHKDGTVDWTRWECRPWYSADGTVGGIIVYTELINESKQAEADLIAAKEKAEESDRLKSAFLANMSHEIRTPLNSIVGFSELLRDSYYEEEQKADFIDLIVKNGQYLLAIINDILDISKIQAGELNIKMKELPVNNFLKDIVREYEMKYRNAPVEFQYGYSDDVKDVAVLCDPERLSQVLNNLLSNAGKFTKQGFVSVGIQIKDGFAEFRVKDTGIGIAPEFHEKIFERFRQVENADSRTYGGNGLGLAISKKLVELMGGTIWVKSQKGVGSDFYFTLPLAK
ncbi:MAG: PAS domain S-box protein [Bacteroidales bacterium]